jgi:hypothetical protein
MREAIQEGVAMDYGKNQKWIENPGFNGWTNNAMYNGQKEKTTTSNQKEREVSQAEKGPFVPPTSERSRATELQRAARMKQLLNGENLEKKLGEILAITDEKRFKQTVEKLRTASDPTAYASALKETALEKMSPPVVERILIAAEGLESEARSGLLDLMQSAVLEAQGKIGAGGNLPDTRESEVGPEKNSGNMSVTAHSMKQARTLAQS